MSREQEEKVVNGLSVSKDVVLGEKKKQLVLDYLLSGDFCLIL